jgi:hypothetical protein
VGPHDTAWTFEGWVAYVFDRPVAAPEWWFGFGEELPADPPPAEAVAFVTRLCEQADALLAPYSNAQVNQGLWYLVGSGASGLTLATRDAGVPTRSWTDCVRAFGALYARLFAPRCSPHLGHLDEPGTDRSTARATCGGTSSRSRCSPMQPPARPSTRPAWR